MPSCALVAVIEPLLLIVPLVNVPEISTLVAKSPLMAFRLLSSEAPATFNAPPMPTPPRTTKAPVVELVLTAKLAMVITLLNSEALVNRAATEPRLMAVEPDVLFRYLIIYLHLY